jgi:hypothetical protein
MLMRMRPLAALTFGLLTACQSAAVTPPTVANDDAAQAPARVCQGRANVTLSEVEQCIERRSLWSKLEHFQLIADANPGPGGHGNRDTGTLGYRASVGFVAKLMRHAGYAVTIQRYELTRNETIGVPRFDIPGRHDAKDRDWFVARLSGLGSVTAAIEPPSGSPDGCATGDFSSFTRGHVALVERGACDFDTQVARARAAGSAAVVLYAPASDDLAYEARLVEPAAIPVIGVVGHAMAADLLARYRSGRLPVVHVEVRGRHKSDVDYNVIADSPNGDPDNVVVVDAHLDSIYGAGMLDNASGSTTNLEVALSMSKTPTRNRLRYIWFGGEEIGLLGSRYYTKHLTRAQLHRIAFDVDVDVTATPNFDILIADPKFARRAKDFPPNVIPESKIGNDYFADFFSRGGVVSRPAWFGNNGTDSLSFSFAGVPNTGILTQQDCCKHEWEVRLWGGFRGDYEGKVPGYHGSCVDRPHRWCDNLYNNDPFVLELTSRAVAYVAFRLANRRLRR